MNIFDCCKFGNSKRLQEHLQNGIDINIKDDDHNTLLHFAVRSGHLSIVQELIKRGIHLNEANWCC